MGNKTKKGIPTTKFVIDVTGVELTEEQKDEAMRNIAARLHGYHTESPDFFNGAEITISRTVKDADKMKMIRKAINQYCTCDKPWGVNGTCIICEKLINID